MPQTKTSLGDIAQQCGVSVSTVSYVLSGKTNRFSEATRKQIHDTAARLHYAPNRAGKALQAGVSRTIALFYCSPMDRSVERLLGRAGTFFHSHGYTFVSVAVQTNDMKRINEDLRSGLCDGAIIACNEECSRAFLTNTAYSPVPVVVLTSAALVPPPSSSNISLMPTGEMEAVLDGLNYLHACGAHTIAYMGPEKENLRYHAYLQWARVHQADVIVSAGYEIFHGFDAALRVFRTRNSCPDAFYCASDRLAIGALMAASVCGMNIPHDLAILGTGASAEGACFRPALTTIGLSDTSIDELLSHLWDRLNHPQVSATTLRDQHWHVIARETTQIHSKQRKGTIPSLS